MTIELIPLEGLPEVRAGDDLAALLAPALVKGGVRAGDVIAVTQKIVSKAEARVVSDRDGRSEWVERETRRVVARRGDLVIAETRHGFVCANAGVDASNVADGFVSLLPEDPDGTAERLRAALVARLGFPVAVVITDTFGRPWRHGVVNVAIGVAGMPALIDLRGSSDHYGRELETTVVALADEIAAASGLAMPKAGRIPAVILRGVSADGADGGARALVRSPQEDLFRESPLVSISARRTIRSFGPGGIEREALEEAVRAACTAPAPHHTRPWIFVAVDSPAARRRLLATMAGAWRADLARDGTPEPVIARRVARSEALLGRAPALIVPAIRLQRAHAYPDDERAGAERDMFVLSGGAAIQNLLLALHAQGLASCWISSTLFCREETRAALGLDGGWLPMGAVAVGPLPDDEPPARPELPIDEHLRAV